MLDEKDGDVEGFPRLADERHHLGGLARIHPCRRLIEQEQFRPRRESPSHFQPPLLAVGEIAGENVAAALQPDEAQEFQRLIVRLLLASPRMRAN